MVYIPKTEQKIEEPEIGVPFTLGSKVRSSDRLGFVFELIGADKNSSLQKAKEMGLTGDDLGFIEQQDVDTLLSSSLQRRKLMTVCKYLKNGTLRYGMTMADVYNGPATPATGTPSDSAPLKESITSSSNNNNDNHETKPATNASSTAANGQQENSNNGSTKRDWLNEATMAFSKLSGQMRQMQRLKTQIHSITKQFSACVSA